MLGRQRLRCADVEALGFSDVEALGFSDVEAFGCTDVEASGLTPLRCADDEGFRCADVEALGFSDVEAFGCADVEALGFQAVTVRHSWAAQTTKSDDGLRCANSAWPSKRSDAGIDRPVESYWEKLKFFKVSYGPQVNSSIDIAREEVTVRQLRRAVARGYGAPTGFRAVTVRHSSSATAKFHDGFYGAPIGLRGVNGPAEE